MERDLGQNEYFQVNTNKTTMSSNYQKEYNKAIPKIVNGFHEFYLGAYNIYALYWLYKIIWVLPFDWENLAIWFFAIAGLYYFILDNRTKLGMENYHKRAE